MANTDPTSEEYQAKTDVIALVGLALLMLAWVIGPLLCIIWNAF